MLKKISFGKRIARAVIGCLSPKFLASVDIYRNMHYWIDLRHPKDLNEKILWLSFNSDTTKWSELADKYRVRQFIKQKGYEDILVKLYGAYDKAEDIVYEALPDSFILKTNNGSGTNIVIKDKNTINKEEINRLLNKWLRMKIGWPIEPHYSRIKPKIIVEELLIETRNVSSSLIDYKVWCLDGKAKCIWCALNRESDHVYVENHFLDWSFHPETEIFNNRFRNGEGSVPKPHNLERMLKVAEDLAQGFPQVRVDFYEVSNKLYFGEMTFTSDGGRMDYFTRDFLLEMGKDVSLQ